VLTLPRFAKGFLFGAATSAHQIEGGADCNDWSAFEAEPGRIRNNERSGIATGHWDRVEADADLLVDLGANAYRFSLEWARLEPREGSWDDAAWEHYARELAALAARGITPMVTLLHFTLPRWLAARGGVTAPDFAARFGRFADEAAQRLAGVSLWCTINEPNVQMFQGYVEGIWPPAVRDHQLAARAFTNLLHAHAAAATVLRARLPHAQRGLAINLIDLEARWPWWPPDRFAAAAAAHAFNWAFCDAVHSGRVLLHIPSFPFINTPLPSLRGSSDFIGVNYYTRLLVHFSLFAAGLVSRRPGPGPRSDLDWEIFPQGLSRVLARTWTRYRLPIYITENGLADADGTRRGDFLRAHLGEVARAVGDGIPVRGYFHWSLLDNFEWAEGFAPRFGLYRVDYATLARTPTPAVETFRSLARAIL
jgi:beta-glucosidase